MLSSKEKDPCSSGDDTWVFENSFAKLHVSYEMCTSCISFRKAENTGYMSLAIKANQIIRSGLLTCPRTERACYSPTGNLMFLCYLFHDHLSISILDFCHFLVHRSNFLALPCALFSWRQLLFRCGIPICSQILSRCDIFVCRQVRLFVCCKVLIR